MDHPFKKFIASVDSAINRRLYLQTIIVAFFLIIVICISIWAGNTLNMITTIARFERTHTVSRIEAIAALLKYIKYNETESLEEFQKKIAITQSYNKVFANLIDFSKTRPDDELVRILEDTFMETDHKTAVIIVNRMKILRWHPIVEELVNYAALANSAGEKIREIVPQFISAKNIKHQRSVLSEIEKLEKDFILLETSFSKRCSDLASELSMYLKYLSIALLILFVGFTSLFSYVIAKIFLRQASKYTMDLEKEIQERIQAEEALQHSYSLLSAIIESPKDIAIFSLDRQMRYTAFNDNHKRYMKQIYDVDVEIGMCLLDLLSDDRDQAKASIAKAFNGEHFTINQQYGLTEPKNTYETSYNPIFDRESGNVTGVTIFIVDISDKIRLETMFLQAQKMEAIGTLAGGIAHDFNNILGGIVGYAQLAEYEVSPDSTAHDYIEHVLTASYRARDLVMQILSFSRQSDQEKKPVNIAMIIRETVKLLRASIPATIDIGVDIRHEPLLTIGDPSQMQQVIMNLCTNARQAIGDKPGNLTITAEYVSSLSNAQRLTSGLAEGPYIRLEISDTGCGMPPNVMDRIFEPYFTTKPKGEGTGLGLSVIHRIITNNAGAISVKSTPGKGTAFLVFLPFNEAHEIVIASEEKKLMTGKERVLFVDDETTLVEIGNKILQRLGYKTIATDSPEEALKIFKASPDRFDILISDMNMPKMTGELLTKECHTIRPDLPVILCTGFSESITSERAKAAGINTVLLKPLLIRDLAEAIRQVLDTRDTEI